LPDADEPDLHDFLPRKGTKKGHIYTTGWDDDSPPSVAAMRTCARARRISCPATLVCDFDGVLFGVAAGNFEPMHWGGGMCRFASAATVGGLGGLVTLVALSAGPLGRPTRIPPIIPSNHERIAD